MQLVVVSLAGMAHCSSKFDEVSRNAVLTECIKREQRAQKLNQVFTVTDPRKSGFPNSSLFVYIRQQYHGRHQ